MYRIVIILLVLGTTTVVPSTTTVVLGTTVVVNAQEKTIEIDRELKSFERVIASPYINLILEQGDREYIRIVGHRISPEKINIKQNGKTLHIYLDDAKTIDKTQKRDGHWKPSVYKDVAVTAYVTYRSLEGLEIRGNQEMTCLDPIRAENFVLKAYGENDITLASLNTGYLKTRLYGENNLKIKDGKAEYQKYSLYGENEIDTRQLRSYSTTANIFGESKLQLNSQDELRISSFGEGQVLYEGNAQVNKRLMFGQTQIRHLTDEM